MHRALNEGRYRQVAILLDIGSDVDVLDSRGMTPLMRCCCDIPESPAKDLSGMFLQYGADKSIADTNGRNALILAAEAERTWMVRKLLNELNFDLNKTDSNGNTALHMCVKHGNLPITKMIVRNLKLLKMTLDCIDNDGMTALMVACRYGYLKISRLLVKNGASIHKKDNVYFLGPLEWIATMYDIPLDCDPFDEDVVMKKNEIASVPMKIIFRTIDKGNFKENVIVDRIIDNNNTRRDKCGNFLPLIVDNQSQNINYKSKQKGLLSLFSMVSDQMCSSFRTAAVRPPSPKPILITEDTESRLPGENAGKSPNPFKRLTAKNSMKNVLVALRKTSKANLLSSSKNSLSLSRNNLSSSRRLSSSSLTSSNSSVVSVEKEKSAIGKTILGRLRTKKKLNSSSELSLGSNAPSRRESVVSVTVDEIKDKLRDMDDK